MIDTLKTLQNMDVEKLGEIKAEKIKLDDISQRVDQLVAAGRGDLIEVTRMSTELLKFITTGNANEDETKTAREILGKIKKINVSKTPNQ